VEDLSGQQRQNCPFPAKGSADKGVYRDEEDELGQVLRKPRRSVRPRPRLPGGFI
jgi:hypothetical protein